jgi:hypothetical protein
VVRLRLTVNEGTPAADWVVRLRLTVKRNSVQKVAGTLRVPSAEPPKALLLEGYGTWNVPTTLLP